MGDNNNDDDDDENDDTTNTLGRNRNQVVVDHDFEAFRRLCDRLQENEEGLTKILAILHQTLRRADFSLFVERLVTNSTLQVLSIGLGTVLTHAQMEALGRVFVNNTHIRNFRLINVATEEMDLRPLWDGLFQSKALDNVCLDGFQTRQNAIETFLTRWNDSAQQLQQQPQQSTSTSSACCPQIVNLHISDCFLGTAETDAIVRMLQRNDMNNFVFRITKCQFTTANTTSHTTTNNNSTCNSRQRIADALAQNTTVEIFALDDALDKTSAQAFGRAIATNTTLNGVMFDNCNDDALLVLANGICQNHKLLNASVQGKQQQSGATTETQAECERLVQHAIGMNKAGRCLLYDYARKEGKNLDVAWLVCLLRSLEEDPAILYSWVRDYVDIFVRWALRGMLAKKRKATCDGSSGRPNKRIKTS
ncbi:expressed unknown protein [Seminavis robusta]|uniref:Uncharacterized protein n=1 Tax=Seminavis robusta TaxID=568900 RepID=A0A9N8DHF2_9STRA|nr:expressed unknown protein [Seminavis robusta]|eukprot:Sro68_g037910.1 n/a (421) ;mRNA; f:14316-15578